jgi:ribosomal protein S18 acetylase RimI-like enzyme
MNSVLQIGKITEADINEIQKLAKQTFYESFSSYNTPENMQIYMDSSFSNERLKNEIINPFSEWYFARLHNMPIGYLKINYGQAQTELQDDKAIEIERIYVLQEFQRQKIGQMLFEKAMEIANNGNVDYIWLDVWEKI